MTQQERPLKERIWEFTKDISVKVSKKAEKHWKINTLRVEIASIKHRINVKYKDLGRYVFESFKANTLEDPSFQSGRAELFEELGRLESEIVEREKRIEALELEADEESGSSTGSDEYSAPTQPPPVPKDEDASEKDEDESTDETPKKSSESEARDA